MDYLWSPWRYQYVTRAAETPGCIFCEKPAAGDDEAHLIVYRGARNFILLNLFPYTSGHVLIAPYQHVATLEDADEETVTEMMLLARRTGACLKRVYKPQGLNIGMNIGECAGAGIAGHIHMHVLPRWTGDSNFMTTIGETRVVPEDLSDTYSKLKEALEQP
jgi:ATP adenylyltransferase